MDSPTDNIMRKKIFFIFNVKLITFYPEHRFVFSILTF